MRKIAISIESSFGLSDSALLKLAEKKGITIYGDCRSPDYVLRWTVPESQWKTCPDYNIDPEGYKEYVEYEHKYNFDYFASDISRDDKDLIAVIEELGNKSSELEGSIHIVKIPDDVDWQIGFNDEFGYEWVDEKHRSWHYDCNSENNTKEY